ncbi:MAG: endolytic transglycosylase MltG [Jatrophihabitans sp.]
MGRHGRESVDSDTYSDTYSDTDDGSLDTHDSLFFGSSDDEHDDHDHHHSRGARPRPAPGPSRQDTRSRVEQHNDDHRRRRVFGIVAVALAVMLALTVWLVGLPIYHYVFPTDYDGAGSGTVVVTVRANDGSGQIGQTLVKSGVVGSARAFTDEASGNSRAQNIQPGSYKLHKHMSAARALALLLTPSARLNSDTVVTEGATIVDVERRLTAPPCTSASTTGAGCGLGLSQRDVTKALTDVQALGLPTDYLDNGKQPASVEGFLYPATYTFDDRTSVADGLQQMIGKFTDEARSTKFTARAKALGLTPYDALIIASIAQGEAKYAADMPMVVRVILNRLKIHRPLQVDATSAYAAKLKGLDPSKEIYAETKGPFNTYRNDGLPPTPIGNPGMDAMQAAISPAAGNYLYYVNGDAAGHLFFTNSEAAFAKAAATCRQNHWGCG